MTADRRRAGQDSAEQPGSCASPALRTGAELSVLGAFRYSSVLWAIAIGFSVWGDVPNPLAMAGIAVIVASGLYILHRERVRAAERRR